MKQVKKKHTEIVDEIIDNAKIIMSNERMYQLRKRIKIINTIGRNEKKNDVLNSCQLNNFNKQLE